jgi:REP element-mobilizing transposase RayT
MSRRARVVVLNYPHHVTQRGNKRERIFFEEGDQQVYLDLMAEQLAKHEIACWSYCLMANHVHFILVPTKPDTLARAVGEAYRRYTLHVGQREKWRGHLFQGRFYSVAMDEGHLMATFRYVAPNPVKAKLPRGHERGLTPARRQSSPKSRINTLMLPRQTFGSRILASSLSAKTTSKVSSGTKSAATNSQAAPWAPRNGWKTSIEN